MTDEHAISFTEHVFYRFAQGRIVRVWSLLDLETVREQLLAASPVSSPP